MQKAFTLIEILVVVTIIGLLALAGLVSYSQFMKQSRDARRKADIELVRSALEMYRSVNNAYPTSIPITGLPWGGDLVDQLVPTGIYMKKIPTDPHSNDDYSYYYSTDANGTTYTLGAHFESTTSGCSPALSSPSCQPAAAVCNYCMGPYGQL